MTTTTAALAERALDAARLGLAVFPIEPGGKVPMHKGWQDEATCSLERVAAMWDAVPEANIGVATGRPSGVVVVDVDRKPGRPDGFLMLEDLRSTLQRHQARAFDEAWFQDTPSGGRHYLFRADGHYRCRAPAFAWEGVRVPSIDVRADGGYIVFAGSRTPGGDYEPCCEDLVAADLPILPEPLAVQVRHVPKPARSPATQGTTGSVQGVTMAGIRRVAGVLDRLRRTPPGGRNDALYRASFTIGGAVGAGLLSRSWAENAIDRAIEVWGSVTPTKDAETIRRGLDAGKEAPLRD